jgi:HSP20 family molecular chaperone IbpA
MKKKLLFLATTALSTLNLTSLNSWDWWPWSPKAEDKQFDDTFFNQKFDRLKTAMDKTWNSMRKINSFVKNQKYRVKLYDDPNYFKIVILDLESNIKNEDISIDIHERRPQIEIKIESDSNMTQQKQGPGSLRYSQQSSSSIWRRSELLPPNTNPSSCQAVLQNSILTISLAKHISQRESCEDKIKIKIQP